MTKMLMAAVSLAALVATSCKTRGNNEVRSSASGRGDIPDKFKVKDEFTGSPAYAETQIPSFTFSDPALGKAAMRLTFSPITQCDLMAWAEAAHPNLDTDPAEVAKAYKVAKAASADYIDYKEFKSPAKNPKKAGSYQEGVEIATRYLTYTDTDADTVLAAETTAFVREVWVQALIDFARGWGGVGYTGDNTNRTASGEKFTPAAVAECKAYVAGIQNSNWSCMQHMAGDYLAHVIAGDSKYTDSDADRAEWSKKLATSAYSKKIPFFSVINAVPGTGAAVASSRRYEMPTVSYRTMKALSGYATASGKTKQLQDLGLKAACYFDKNKAMDSRVTPFEKWRGYWDTSLNGSGVEAFCSFDDAKGETSFIDQATSCTGLDLTTVDF